MTTEKTPQAKPLAETKRTPLENFIDGFPIDLAKRTLSTDLAELLMGGDVSAYMNVRATAYLPTAVLPVRQPMMPLGKRPMPEIGSVQAETEHLTIIPGIVSLGRSRSRVCSTSENLQEHHALKHGGHYEGSTHRIGCREDNAEAAV